MSISFRFRRYTPLLYSDRKFRCRVDRRAVAELLANGEAVAECDRCKSTTAEGTCIGGEHHDVILVLKPASFDRKGPPSSLTHAEIEANAGAHGYIAKVRVRAKLEDWYGTH